MRNLDIRVMVSESGLRYIDIAKQMGISRVWLSNLMRYDLTAENREKILKAIRELTEHPDAEGLKSCPFCGGTAVFEDYGQPGEFEDWAVYCRRCGIAMLAPGPEAGCVSTREDAARAWNRRCSHEA